LGSGKEHYANPLIPSVNPCKAKISCRRSDSRNRAEIGTRGLAIGCLKFHHARERGSKWSDFTENTGERPNQPGRAEGTHRLRSGLQPDSSGDAQGRAMPACPAAPDQFYRHGSLAAKRRAGRITPRTDGYSASIESSRAARGEGSTGHLHQDEPAPRPA